MSFPPGTEMFQFPGFALLTLYIQAKSNWFNLRSSAVSPRDRVPNGPKARANRFACVFARAKTSKTTNNQRLSVGFPHSEIHGSKPVRGSPWLIAAYCVLHRLLLPRHPPNALLALDPIQKKKDAF